MVILAYSKYAMGLSRNIMPIGMGKNKEEAISDAIIRVSIYGFNLPESDLVTSEQDISDTDLNIIKNALDSAVMKQIYIRH